MPKARGASFWNPNNWTTTDWGKGSETGSADTMALPAGITIVTTPAHPLASTLSESVLEFDGNNASNFTDRTTAPDAQQTFTTNFPPDSTRGWAARASALFRWNGTAPTGDATILWFNNGCKLLHVSGGSTFKLNVDGVDVATGAVNFSSNTWYQIDVFERYKNAAGTDLPKRQFIVRLLYNLGASTSSLDLINVSVTRSTGTAGLTSIGPGAAYGAGYKFWLANIYSAWEDSYDIYTVIRGDQMIPDGTGHLNEWTGNAADVDESPPDDATTEDSYAADQTHTPKTQLYTLSAPSYITGSDKVISVNISHRVKRPTLAKGVTESLSFVLSDGTNDTVGQYTLATTNAWAKFKHQFSYNPWNSSDWAVSDMAGLQAGVKLATNNPTAGGSTFEISSILVQMPYQKSGDTAPSLPAEPATGSIAFPLRPIMHFLVTR